MTTFINLGNGDGYLNAAEVVRLRVVRDLVEIQTTPGTLEHFHPTATGTRPAEEILSDLLAVLGSSELGSRTGIITLIEGKVDVRHLEIWR